MRILLVEDEPILNQQITSFLNDNGYAVDSVLNAQDGLFAMREYALDAAIVDIGLPDFSGLQLIKKARQSGINIPVLVLTARSRWQDKVNGLEAGADDYLAKPFHYPELAARINALIRRSMGQAHPTLQHGDIVLDTTAQQILRKGMPLEITAFEYKILQYLMLHKGEVISKSQLAEHIYNEDSDRDSNVIEVIIARLRKKLDPDGASKPIETLRGRGYRIPA